MGITEAIILLILWFAVGCIYLLNLCGSEQFDELSDNSRAIILVIFLPTTLVVLLIDFIQRSLKKWKKKKSGKTLKDMRDYIK